MQPKKATSSEAEQVRRSQRKKTKFDFVAAANGKNQHDGGQATDEEEDDEMDEVMAVQRPVTRKQKQKLLRDLEVSDQESHEEDEDIRETPRKIRKVTKKTKRGPYKKTKVLKNRNMMKKNSKKRDGNSKPPRLLREYYDDYQTSSEESEEEEDEEEEDDDDGEITPVLRQSGRIKKQTHKMVQAPVTKASVSPPPMLEKFALSDLQTTSNNEETRKRGRPRKNPETSKSNSSENAPPEEAVSSKAKVRDPVKSFEERMSKVIETRTSEFWNSNTSEANSSSTSLPSTSAAGYQNYKQMPVGMFLKNFGLSSLPASSSGFSKINQPSGPVASSTENQASRPPSSSSVRSRDANPFVNVRDTDAIGRSPSISPPPLLEASTHPNQEDFEFSANESDSSECSAAPLLGPEFSPMRNLSPIENDDQKMEEQETASSTPPPTLEPVSSMPGKFFDYTTMPTLDLDYSPIRGTSVESEKPDEMEVDESANSTPPPTLEPLTSMPEKSSNSTTTPALDLDYSPIRGTSVESVKPDAMELDEILPAKEPISETQTLSTSENSALSRNATESDKAAKSSTPGKRFETSHSNQLPASSSILKIEFAAPSDKINEKPAQKRKRKEAGYPENSAMPTRNSSEESTKPGPGPPYRQSSRLQKMAQKAKETTPLTLANRDGRSTSHQSSSSPTDEHDVVEQKLSNDECGVENMSVELSHLTIRKFLIQNPLSAKRFVCSECNHSTSDLDTHRRHLSSHSETEGYKFECCDCSFKAWTPTLMALHLKMHSYDTIDDKMAKEYKKSLGKNCSRKDQERWMLFDKLNRAIKKPIKEPEYEKVRLPMSQKARAMHRTRQHTSSKALTCSLCDFKVMSQPLLDQHIERHGWNQLYCCALCDYSDNTKSVVDFHQLAHHVNAGQTLISLVQSTNVKVLMGKIQEGLNGKPTPTSDDVAKRSGTVLRCGVVVKDAACGYHTHLASQMGFHMQSEHRKVPELKEIISHLYVGLMPPEPSNLLIVE